MSRLAFFIAAAICLSSMASGAEVLLPQTRAAYYADEAIELAVVGLDQNQQAKVELAPAANAVQAFVFTVTGDGSTVNSRIPAGALAPGKYAVRLDGQATPVSITVSSGVNDSTTLVSQTARTEQLHGQEGNFIVGNAFGFGMLNNGMPAESDLRRRTNFIQTYDRAIEYDLPTLIYMYWTGYVLHKPWGSKKSWSAPQMQKMMRLFNFHAGQRLRKYAENIGAVGTIDEPGLNWGTTPAGGWATGFPCWDQQPWYQRHGWDFTHDPGNRSADDWLKYLTIRCGIIGDSSAIARRDLMASWPDMNFETDIYACHIVSDGADAMNQVVNGDTPTTHVFLGWGIGRDCTATEIYIEKSNNPAANVAHAMNGQLIGSEVPLPQRKSCYHLMMNGMLQSGLQSNWWLNWGRLGGEAVAEVNEPAKRYGPALAEMKTTGHDVAILWGYSELAMRVKEITAATANKAGGEQIKLMIATLPENTALDQGELVLSGYNVGQNYRLQVSQAHNALMRAGYPAHVVHERILPSGVLKNYKTLVIVGQQHSFLPETQQAIRRFVAAGGKIVVDNTTAVEIPGAVKTSANFKDPAFRWSPLFTAAQQNPESFETLKEASYYQTNYFMDEPIYAAVAPMKEAMANTDSRHYAETDSTDLIFERHVSGDGAVYMVLNSHQELPEIPADQKYSIWNYAPYRATFQLKGIEPGSIVYAVEGLDWKKVSKIDATKPITADFEAGEMKLYFVAPQQPGALDVAATVSGGMLEVSAKGNLQTAWPISVQITKPNGELHTVYRSLKTDGTFAEKFPVGSNAPGEYSVTVGSPVGYQAGTATAAVAGGGLPVELFTAKARIFDKETIEAFLAEQPRLTVAFTGDQYRQAAEKLATELTARGILTRIAAEADVYARAEYPRVWNPYSTLYTATADEKEPTGEVTAEVELETIGWGAESAITPDGKDLGSAWKTTTGTLATVTGDGYIDYSAANGEHFYEKGCKIYINGKKQPERLNCASTQVKSDLAFREKWSRPWMRIGTYHGGYNLPPQLPEAYECGEHLILLGDSTTSELIAAIQGGELPLQYVDAKYPGPGKSLVSFVWSPFAVEKNVIMIGASDADGVNAGIAELLKLVD